MTSREKEELLRRIAALEAKVAALEARPPQIITVPQPYPYPAYPQPWPYAQPT